MIYCSPKLEQQSNEALKIPLHTKHINMFDEESCTQLPYQKSIEVDKNAEAKFGLAHSFPQKSSFKTRNSQKEFKKKVSFNDVPNFTYHYPSITSDGIFWINEMQFHQKVKRKSNTFNKSSKKKKFIDVLANVLEKNFRIIATIYSFIVKFDGYNIMLTQTENPFSIDKMFPSSKTIAELEKTKENFKNKLIELFHLIEPASEVNEDLSNMIDMINAKTKITQNQLDQLMKESKKVDGIFQHFQEALNDFNIRTYIKHLSNIRVTVNELEDNVINHMNALFTLQTDLIELNKFCPKMEKSLDAAAMEINYTELEESMKKIHHLAKTILNTVGTSKWVNDVKKWKKIDTFFFGIPIRMRS